MSLESEAVLFASVAVESVLVSVAEVAVVFATALLLLVSVASDLVVSVDVVPKSALFVVVAAAAFSAGVVVSAETVPPVVSMNDTPIKADAKPKLYFLKPKRCFCSSLRS